MAGKSEKYARRRWKSSYVSTVVSMALVLFVLGTLGLVILQARDIADHVKEQIELTVFFKESAGETDIIRFQKTLESRNYVKHTRYVSKDDAAQEMQEALGEDFVSFIGINPLLPSLSIYLHAGYANNDSLAWITREVMESTLLDDLVRDENLIGLVNSNIRRIGMVMLAFTALLLVVAIALVNNTIRLDIYSRRFLVRSMQLVGATQSFIRRPFVLTGINQGLFASVIAISMLIGVLLYVQQRFPDLFTVSDPDLLLPLFGALILFGVLIAWGSTFFAVRKYLRLRPDDLY